MNTIYLVFKVKVEAGHKLTGDELQEIQSELDYDITFDDGVKEIVETELVGAQTYLPR